MGGEEEEEEEEEVAWRSRRGEKRERNRRRRERERERDSDRTGLSPWACVRMAALGDYGAPETGPRAVALEAARCLLHWFGGRSQNGTERTAQTATRGGCGLCGFAQTWRS
jgi:hypothetical protein